MPTQCDVLIRHVLRDEALTRGLGDIEARMLAEWVADWTGIARRMPLVRKTMRGRATAGCAVAGGPLAGSSNYGTIRSTAVPRYSLRLLKDLTGRYQLPTWTQAI